MMCRGGKVWGEDEGLGDFVQAQGPGSKSYIAPGIFAHIAARGDAVLAAGAKTIYAADVHSKMLAENDCLLWTSGAVRIMSLVIYRES